MKAFELCICALYVLCIFFASSIITLQSTLSRSFQFLNSCAIEAGINYEDNYEDNYDVRKILNDTIEKPELEEKTLKYGCVVECVLRKLNWMQELELKEEKLYTDINKIFANHSLKIQIEEFIRNCVTKVKLVPQERCKRGVVAMKCGVKGAFKLFPSLFE